MRYHISNQLKLIAEAFHLDVSAICRRVNLSVDWIENADGQVSEEMVYALWHGVKQEAVQAGYINFEVSLARACLELPLEPAIYAFSCGDTVFEGLVRLAKYKPLVGPFELLISCEDNGEVVLEFASPSRRNNLPKSLALFETVFVLLIARRFSGLEIKPVSFEYHYPIEDEKDFAEQMSVNAEKSDRTRLVLSGQDAQSPLMTKSPQMWLQIEPMLEARLAALKPSDTMSARVQHELGQVLPAGNVSSHIIAKRLAVSQRTLQRRLTDEGTNFQRVLKGLRTELAKDYLKSTDLNLSEIALLLGFQDTNSFFRAFRSWTDKTPNQYRSNARNKNTLIP